MKDLSFDMPALQQYPSAWNTYGASIPIKNIVKLTPPLVPNVNGGFFLKEHLLTPAWEADFRIVVRNQAQLNKASKSDNLDIFALWYLLS